jgi:6-phosphogluconate dehydrogenase
MQMGMIGLGRMGNGLVRRLMQHDHDCVVYDMDASAVDRLVAEGATGARTVAQLLAQLARPRVIWLMIPASLVDASLAELAPLLEPDDIVIDGGNSFYRDDMRRAARLREASVHYVDVGTSGGVAGIERGFCLMIGGEPGVVQRLTPLFEALSPGEQAAAPTPGRRNTGSAERGFLHCGPPGAGHFVKMVHNGIEYGIMAAYAEGLNILRGANAGHHPRAADAETSPLREPEAYGYEFELSEIAEVWRRGSVISSWLLDLTAGSLAADPQLDGFKGRVSDSGEGRWTVQAAIDESVPAPVLSAALYARFASRGESDFADRLLSAMRHQFGGHHESPAKGH